jgi:hypothetical protein
MGDTRVRLAPSYPVDPQGLPTFLTPTTLISHHTDDASDQVSSALAPRRHRKHRQPLQIATKCKDRYPMGFLKTFAPNSQKLVARATGHFNFQIRVGGLSLHEPRNHVVDNCWDYALETLKLKPETSKCILIYYPPS